MRTDGDERHGLKAALGGLLALTLLSLPLAAAWAGPGSERLPDLVADPPTNAYLQVYDYGDGRDHLLVRFNGFIHNQGQGPLELRGSARSGETMTSTAQRIFGDDGSFADDRSGGLTIRFEREDGHDHWHVKAAARYSLWNASRTAEAVPAMKVGFCLADSERREPGGPAGAVYTTSALSACRRHEPSASSVWEGISAGWRDVYGSNLAFQWVDVSEVQPGTYWVGAQMDPEGRLRESNEANNGPALSAAAVTLPGHVAAPLALAFPNTRPSTLLLGASSFGRPGPLMFRITSAPAHGTIDRLTGVPFNSPQVVYTPNRGYNGVDSFSYVAFDPANPFPRAPAPASVTLSVGLPLRPAVTISGAPRSMRTRGRARLKATVVGDSPRVTWKVNRVRRGKRPAGRISRGGLYVAPARVPRGGAVRIRAQAPSGAFGVARIRIVRRRGTRPAPSAPERRGRGPLGPLSVAQEGRLLLATAVAKRAGVVRVRALTGSRAFGRCRLRVSARQPFTCKLRLARGLRPTRARIVATLHVRGKRVAIRRARVS